MAPSIWSRSRTLLADAESAKDLATIIKKGVGGTLLAGVSVIIGGTLAAGDVVIEPMVALSGVLGDLVVAIFGQPAEILIAGGTSTVNAFLGQFNLGPFTFPAAVGVVLFSLWMVGRYRDEEETGNLIPGLPFDVPFIGESEEGES